MYVPYSMDDSEPDLHGGMGGHRFDDDQFETQTKWDSEDSSYTRDVELDRAVEAFRRETYVYTQEQMDKVIQFNIKAVRKAYDEGYQEGYDDGHAEGNYNCQHR